MANNKPSTGPSSSAGRQSGPMAIQRTSVGWPEAFFAEKTNSDHLPPGIAFESLDGLYPLVRDWVVDLGALLTRVSAGEPKPVIGALRVYADTVVIPEGFSIALDYTLIVAARWILVGEGARLLLDLTGNAHAQILICAKHFPKTLAVQCRWTGPPAPAVRDTLRREYVLGKSARGVCYRLWQPSPNVEPVTETLAAVPPDLTIQTRPLYRLLVGEYQAATVLLSRGLPADAGDIADWVRRCAASNARLVTLGVDAATLAAQARSMESAASYAPRLSVRVYQSLSRSYVDALAAHEGKVRDLELMAHIDDDFREIAKSVLGEAERTAQYDERVLEQTLQSFHQTELAVGESEHRLRSRLNTIELLKIDLEAEAKKHLYDAILSAGFEICVHIVSSTVAIGGAVAGVVATGGGGAPAAILSVGGKLVEAGEIVLESGAKISFTAQEVQKSGGFASLGKKIDGAAKALYQLGKMVFEIYKIIKTVADSGERAKQISSSLREGDFGEAGVAELTGAYYWDLMKISARTALKMPLAMELPSADQMRNEIDSLAVEGQALAAQRTTLLELGQELTRLVWRQQTSASRSAEARARLEGFENEKEAMEDFADWARVEAASVKRGVFTALYDYVRAYGFWALKPSSVTPSMSEDAPAYNVILSAMEKEISDALSRGFLPAPQPFGGEHQLDKEIRVSGPERLAALRRGEPAVVAVRGDEPVFRDYGRVRVERVRVWLDGIKSAGRPVLVEIQSGGSFFDRLGSETFLFTADRFLLTFQYVPEKGEKGIVTDGLVARRVRDLYCLPTPFTDWTIRVMHADRKGIDLSGLKALRLSFAGSHIYSPGCGHQGL